MVKPILKTRNVNDDACWDVKLKCKQITIISKKIATDKKEYSEENDFKVSKL